jgi:hypothetical protein
MRLLRSLLHVDCPASAFQNKSSFSPATPPGHTRNVQVRKTGRVVRAMCIMSHPIPSTNDSHSVQIILPQKQLNRRAGGAVRGRRVGEWARGWPYAQRITCCPSCHPTHACPQPPITAHLPFT